MECPCPLCHEPHGIEVPELVGRLAADRPARLCALRRLGLALDGSVAGASDSSAAACAVRNAVRAALEAEARCTSIVSSMYKRGASQTRKHVATAWAERAEFEAGIGKDDVG